MVTQIQISAYFFKEVYVIKMARAPQVNSEAFEAQKKEIDGCHQSELTFLKLSPTRHPPTRRLDL